MTSDNVISNTVEFIMGIRNRLVVTKNSPKGLAF